MNSATIESAARYDATQLHLLDAEYTRCWPWLSEALAHGGNLHSRDTLWSMLASGRAHLWPAPNAAAVTCFQFYPGGVVCELWLAGGSLDEILDGEDRIAQWAKASGATHLQINGRPGWARALRAQGWERTAVTLTRRLDHE